MSQIQDISGCRLIVKNIDAQESAVESLTKLFENSGVVDRRKQPSHGYRAVHVIVTCLDKVIEVQIRTLLQQLWAELSEKFSDVVDPAIKYGGGDKPVQDILIKTSTSVAVHELLAFELPKAATKFLLQDGLPDQSKKGLDELQEIVNETGETIVEALRAMIEKVTGLKGESNDISN
ncbi:MAG: RelA/SpoT domain-containing protein [Acidobacteriota bacterium]